MTTTHKILPYPFKEVPVGRMFDVMLGEMKVELKEEWKRVFEPSDRAGERKAA